MKTGAFTFFNNSCDHETLFVWLFWSTVLHNSYLHGRQTLIPLTYFLQGHHILKRGQSMGVSVTTVSSTMGVAVVNTSNRFYGGHYRTEIYPRVTPKGNSDFKLQTPMLLSLFVWTNASSTTFCYWNICLSSSFVLFFNGGLWRCLSPMSLKS